MFPHKTSGEMTAARTGLVQGDTLLDVGKVKYLVEVNARIFEMKFNDAVF